MLLLQQLLKWQLTDVVYCSGTGKSSSSDLGLGGIAGIVVGVVIAAAVGATAVVVYLKRRRTTTRSLLRMQSSGGFSRFEDF